MATLDKILISSSKTYTALNQIVSPGGSYTCPYDAVYMLSLQSDTDGIGAEWTLNGGVIANTTISAGAITASVFLKANSVINTRNRTGQVYSVRGYWK